MSTLFEVFELVSKLNLLKGKRETTRFNKETRRFNKLQFWMKSILRKDKICSDIKHEEDFHLLYVYSFLNTKQMCVFFTLFL